jgi:hypothetical protein
MLLASLEDFQYPYNILLLCIADYVTLGQGFNVNITTALKNMTEKSIQCLLHKM